MSESNLKNFYILGSVMFFAITRIVLHTEELATYSYIGYVSLIIGIGFTLKTLLVFKNSKESKLNTKYETLDVKLIIVCLVIGGMIFALCNINISIIFRMIGIVCLGILWVIAFWNYRKRRL